jgi:hypothetical protein
MGLDARTDMGLDARTVIGLDDRTDMGLDARTDMGLDSIYIQDFSSYSYEVNLCQTITNTRR